MTASQPNPFEILKSSILSRPRMMGTDGEQETHVFLIDFLSKHKLNPYSEEIEWSTAFMEGRKLLYAFMGLFVMLINLCLRLSSPWNSILPGVLAILSIITLVVGMKGLTDDKYQAVGKTFKGQNVLCDIEPQHKKDNTPVIYFTAHSDSISSKHPKLNTLAMLGMLLGFLITISLTLASAVLHWTSPQTAAIQTLTLIILISSMINLLCTAFVYTTKHVNSGPGAVDNGSGSAILLCLAAHFREHPLMNTRLKFIWCTAEEWGLYGSKGYVKAHREEIAAQRERSRLINVDMVGSELAYLKKYGFPFQKPLNKTLNTLIAQTASEAGIAARPFNSVIGSNSDHAPFHKEKVEVCFFLANKDSKIIHSPQDTIEKVKPEKLADAVSLIERLVVKLDTDYVEIGS